MRKWHFSLRTLVVLVLTLAAGATLWKNAPPWRIERAFSGFEEPCDSFLLSPDGKWIWGEIKRRGEKEKPDYAKCKLWSVESGQRTDIEPVVLRPDAKKEQVIDGAYTNTEFSSDSRFVLTFFLSARAYHFKIWDVQTNLEVALNPPTFRTKHVFFSPDGRYLARFSKDTCQLFDLRDSKLVLEQTPVTDGKFSADSSLLALAYKDNTASVFETEGGTLRHRIENRDIDVRTISSVSRERLFVVSELQITSGESSTTLIDLRDPLKAPVWIPKGLLIASPDGSKGILREGTGYQFVNLLTFVLYPTGMVGRGAWPRWSPDSVHVFDTADSSIYVGATGRCLYTGQAMGTTLAGFSRFISAYPGSVTNVGVTIHDMSRGRLLQTIPGERINAFDQFPGEHFITQNETSHAIHYWSRYRPEAWWGLGLLPEAWLFLALTATLLWSIRRDRKTT